MIIYAFVFHDSNDIFRHWETMQLGSFLLSLQVVFEDPGYQCKIITESKC